MAPSQGRHDQVEDALAHSRVGILQQQRAGCFRGFRSSGGRRQARTPSRVVRGCTSQGAGEGDGSVNGKKSDSEK